jgi:catechol 2,3-dioxygenase-like lactoylglutathione lyase family enzyme
LIITVVDIVQTIDFYENLLGVQVLEFAAADGSRRWSLKFGVQKINLHQADVLFVPHAAAQGVNIIDGPVARSGGQGPITSLYIQDPNGNLLEISNLI